MFLLEIVVEFALKRSAFNAKPRIGVI